MRDGCRLCRPRYIGFEYRRLLYMFLIVKNNLNFRKLWLCIDIFKCFIYVNLHFKRWK